MDDIRGLVVDRASFDNSNTTKKKKLEQITTKKVTKDKSGIKDKASEVFLGGETIKSAGGYFVKEMLVPAGKNLIFDIFETVLENIELSLFGRTSGRRRSGTRNRRGTSISYSSYYNNRDRHERSFSNIRSDDRISSRFKNLVFEEKSEAEEVLDNLLELIDVNGEASVEDLYDLTGNISNYTDSNYGWTNLKNANIVNIRDGYLLDLPKPKQL